MTIDDALATVAESEERIEELPVTAGMRLANENTLLLGDSPFRLEGAGFRRFCEQLSAPADYVSVLPARIRQGVLQHHLDCCDASDGRLTAVVRDGEFLAFSRQDLCRLSGRDVLTAVREGVGSGANVHELQIHDESFQTDLLIESAAGEVAPGDIVRAGVRVTHSLTGKHATWIEAFMYRLVCKNGMVHRDCVDRRAARTRRLPTGRHDARRLQIEQVRRLTADTAGTLRAKLEAIRGLRREQVDANSMMVRFLEQGGLSRRTWLPVVRRAWEENEGAESTAFGVMNALTWVSTHEPNLSARQRRILSGLAGILAFRQIHFCPRCFSQLRGPAASTGSADEP
jgi:hypothetical protein